MPSLQYAISNAISTFVSVTAQTGLPSPTSSLNLLSRYSGLKFSFFIFEILFSRHMLLHLVCDIYEPGSTFKILTSAANIEEYLNGNKERKIS